jgi:hypothetical protein
VTLLRRRRALLDQRSVLLRVAVHLRHGLADLADARALLGAGATDVTDDAIDALDRAHHLQQRGAGTVDRTGTVLDTLDGAGDQRLDLARCLRAALRQTAHLAGDDREAAALLASARGLDGSIQRQDVGLEGDAVDGADDVGDPPRALVDALHRLDHLAHRLAAACRHARRVARELAGLACMVGVLAHRRVESVHRRGGLPQGAGLALGAARQVGVAAGDLRTGGGDTVGVQAHRGHGGREAVAHGLQSGHDAGAVTGAQLDRGRQVARGHRVGHRLQLGRFPAELAQGPLQGPAARQQTGGHCQHRGEHHPLGIGSKLVDGRDAGVERGGLPQLLGLQRLHQARQRRQGGLAEHHGGLVLAVLADQRHRLGGGLPESIEEAGHGGKGLPAGVVLHRRADGGNVLVDQRRAGFQAGQRSGLRLGLLGQDGLAQQNLHAGDVELELRQPLQLGQLRRPHRRGVPAELAHARPDESAHRQHRNDQHGTVQCQAHAQPEAGILVHDDGSSAAASGNGAHAAPRPMPDSSGVSTAAGAT